MKKADLTKEFNLQGQRFGRLTVLRDAGKYYRKLLLGNIYWLCKCSCGNLIEVLAYSLKNGHTCSCGCLKLKHGGSETRLYRTWTSMRKRCYNPKDPSYKYYGGKCIQVCAEWKNDFIAFRNWALNNGYADNLTIDRIDNDGNYEPSNCQFLTKSENTRKGSKNLRKERERLFAMIIIMLMRKKRMGWIQFT